MVDAFDQAWSLLKNYTPNWRDEVRDIGPVEEDEMPFIEQWDTDDDEYKEDIEGFLNSGSKTHVFEHPWSEDFVVKVPHDDDYYRDSFKTRRMKPDEAETLQFLEQLGYPLAPEMPGSEWEHTIQPKLNANVMRGGGNMDVNQQFEVADRALAHLIQDRHKGNYGTDSAGHLRNFDLDGIGIEFDRSLQADNPEKYQTEALNPYGIQHPTSKVLDFFNDRDEGRFKRFNDLMRLLEPYSDNPNTLTIDGKPKWLEGYE